jgi:hypothetical protein
MPTLAACQLPRPILLPDGPAFPELEGAQVVATEAFKLTRKAIADVYEAAAVVRRDGSSREVFVIGLDEPKLSYRDARGSERTLPLERVRTQDLAMACPWRTFRSYREQPFYSGMYWSATMGAHVVYESRLELARLLLADFDRAVVTIVAQPFQLRARIDGRMRRHVPDLLLRDETGAASVVDIKPAGLLAEPTVARTLAWAGELIETRGWRFEVWSGCDGVLLTNVRFLAGYRRSGLFSEDLLHEVLAAVGDGDTIAAVERRLALRQQARTVRPALLHLLWRGEVTADLHQVLGGATTLQCSRERAV